MKQVLTVILLGILLSACGGPPPPAPPPSPVDGHLDNSVQIAQQRLTNKVNRQLALKPVEFEEVDLKLPGDSARVIVSQAALRLETENPDSVHREVISYAYTNGGYVLDSRRAKTEIRIPAELFLPALERFELLGKLRDKKIKTDDVTSQYFDLQTRLENALKSRERYLQLLAQANSMHETLRVERELERINQLIESYKGKLGQIGHRHLHATISVQTQEPAGTGGFPGLLSGIGKGTQVALRR